jgi:hypothetical protein
MNTLLFLFALSPDSARLPKDLANSDTFLLEAFGTLSVTLTVAAFHD